MEALSALVTASRADSGDSKNGNASRVSGSRRRWAQLCLGLRKREENLLCFSARERGWQGPFLEAPPGSPQALSGHSWVMGQANGELVGRLSTS